MRAEVVESAFVKLLTSLIPKPEHMELLKDIFRRVWSSRINTAESESALLHTELGKLELKKKRLVDQMAEGFIGGVDFQSAYDAVVIQIADTRQRQSLVESSHLDLDTALGYLGYLLWNPDLVWEGADLLGKRRIQRLIFPSGFAFDSQAENGFGTPSTSSFYSLLRGDFANNAALVAPQETTCIESEGDIAFSTAFPKSFPTPEKRMCIPIYRVFVRNSSD